VQQSFVKISSGTSKNLWVEKIQEGQHPLTGQRAANFRLLPNQ